MLAAVTTGGFFIFGTYHLWWPALASLPLALAVIVYWLWTGTAVIPEKETKYAGLGLTLPLYASGSASVGWWGVCITMLADMTAFVCLVFGYFFFWTRHQDFPPDPSPGPGVVWPAVAAVLVVAAWALTLLARHANRRDGGTLFHAAMAAAVLLSLGGGAALLAGPWVTGLDPTQHVYPATVWILAAWAAAHVGIGVIMHLYCIARRLAGRLSARHDIDIANVALYWHFCVLTVVITVAVIAGFPLVA
jgi:cytochrome c oxidase subunit I+III